MSSDRNSSSESDSSDNELYDKPEPLAPSYLDSQTLEEWVYDNFSKPNAVDVIAFFEKVGVEDRSDFKYLTSKDIEDSDILKPFAKSMLRLFANLTNVTLSDWVRKRFDDDDASQVDDFLKSLGVRTVDDLKYLKPKDVTKSNLLKVVKRKLRVALEDA
jgi:hypothetical protein